MKITGLETIALAIPHDHGGPPTGFGGSSWPRLNVLLVRLETDAGLTGWGEAFSYGCLPAVQGIIDTTIAPLVVGRDATDIAGIGYALQQNLHLFGRYGITMFGISGVDIALWDLAGKRAGLSLRELLGGPREAPRLPGYASLLKYGDRELVAARVSRALEEGYAAVKLHETGVEEVATARSVAGDGFALCVDTNCPWTPREAHEMARRFAPLDLYWLEEPVFPPEDFRALARLRREAGIPLAAGENACTAFQFRHMFDAGAVDFAQPSVTKVGGVSEMLKVMAIAESADVTVMPHCPYFGPGWLATLQLIAAQPSPGWVEHFHTDLEATLYPGYVTPDADGRFRLPDGPGLGLEPDLDVVASYRLPG